MKKYSLKLLILLSVLLTGSMIYAQTPQEALQSLLASKGLDKNQTAIYIWDLYADLPVVMYNAQLPLVPASIMKSVTTAALSETYPYNHQLTTNVYYDGAISNSVLDGNIIIVGGGDPSLGDGRHKDQSDLEEDIAKKLRSLGVVRVKGDIKIDDSFLAGPSTHPSWGTGDLSQSYGTGSHAFNYQGNANGKAAVRDPGSVFRKKLIAALSANGITYEASSLPSSGNKKLLLSYKSPRLSDLMRSCMFRSDNLYAETFLRLFGKKRGTDGSTDQAARIEEQLWDMKDYPLDGVQIVDGSGLSRRNRVTAEFMGAMLKDHMNDPVYVSLFPLVGAEGTVRGFLKDTRLQEYLCMKTGSMNGIQCYAGYVVDEDFMPTHAVVFIANGLKNRDVYRADLQKFLLSVFK